MPKRKILVVDDQEDVLSLLNEALSKFGFEAMVCKDPKKVLDSVRSFHPDLILLDLLMPNLGGFEICEILNNDPETHGIPIIIISGLGDLVEIKKAYKLGVVDYFVKPFALSDLCNEISKVITNKEKPL